MSKRRSLALIAGLALVWTACGPSEEEVQAKKKQEAVAAALTAMEGARGPLVAKRQELNAAKAELAAIATDDATVQAKVESLEKETAKLADDFSRAVTDFINTSDITQGAALTPDQRKAFDYLAEEQILVAKEYIEKAGDYKKAIDIYEQILATDDKNSQALAAKAEAEKLRYMDQARFSQVKPGMSQKEVRAILGQVRNINVREFKEQARVGWFYQTAADGHAAGVYFKEKSKGKGDWIVETAKFDAVKPEAKS